MAARDLGGEERAKGGLPLKPGSLNMRCSHNTEFVKGFWWFFFSIMTKRVAFP